MSEAVDKFVRWVLGDEATATLAAANSMSKYYFGSPLKHQGHAQGDMPQGIAMGGVAWPVDALAFGGVSFLGSDCCFAEFIVSEQKAYLLNDIGVRQTRAKALTRGNNLKLLKPVRRDMYGIVVRGAQFGSAGLKNNIFIAMAPKVGNAGFAIIAHHLPNSPNVNSTPVSDPDDDGNGRTAFVDDQWRVRRYNPTLVAPKDYKPGAGATNVPPKLPAPKNNVYALMLNFGSSGVEQMRGFGLAHFMDAEARLSYHMDGPLRPASSLHDQTQTGEAFLRAGAVNTKAFYTNGSPMFDGPLDFIHEEEPPVSDLDGIWQRVYLRNDSDMLHDSIGGKRPNVWRWAVKIPAAQMPPCKDTQPSDGASASVSLVADFGAPPVYLVGPLMASGIWGLPTPNLHKSAA